MRTTLLFGVLLTSAPGVAQSWAVSAQAPYPGSSMAQAWDLYLGWTTQTASLPAGPVPAGPFLSCTASFGPAGPQPSTTGANWGWSAPSSFTPLAFTASCSYSFVSSALPLQSLLGATLDLRLQAPQPTSGRLRLSRTTSGLHSPLPIHTVDVDLGADGIVDYRAHLVQQVDLPLQIPANGAIVRVVLQISVQGTFANTGLGVRGEFFPGQPVLSVHDQWGAGTSLTWQQTFSQTTVTLSPPGTPLVMAFGTQPLSVALFPTVTLLVTPDVLLATGSVTLPAVPVPSGTSLYAQGLVLDTTNTLRSSNSVRLFWP